MSLRSIKPEEALSSTELNERDLLPETTYNGETRWYGDTAINDDPFIKDDPFITRTSVSERLDLEGALRL